MAALRNVGFELDEGTITGLIGPNGSGKTTLFNLVSGLLKPDEGQIQLKGKDLVGLKPHEICRMGVGRTFQIPQPFTSMTALENTAVSIMFGCTGVRSIISARQEAAQILRTVGLEEKGSVTASSLMVSEKRALELARALGGKPQLLLLDEVLSGLNPAETTHFTNIVKRIRDELGVTVLWIEHIMRAIMTASDRIIVLQQGEKIAEGTPNEVAAQQQVVEAYFGKGAFQL